MVTRACVLVVDDDADSRALLEMALSLHGYSVSLARNGVDALAMARRLRPRVILLDLAMPVMDGYAFRSAQLADAEIAGIPVICVSARHDAALVARTLQLSGCVSKPYALDEIVSRVREVAGPPGPMAATLG